MMETLSETFLVIKAPTILRELNQPRREQFVYIILPSKGYRQNLLNNSKFGMYRSFHVITKIVFKMLHQNMKYKALCR